MPKTREEMIEEIAEHIIKNPAEGWQGFIKNAVKKEVGEWDDEELANWYKT